MGKKKKQKKQIKKSTVITLWALMLALVWFSYWKLSVGLPDLPKPPLKELGAKHGIAVGVHPLEHRLSERVYPDLVTQEFSSLIIDRESHWKTIKAKEGGYDFKETDNIVNFGLKNNMTVQLHHLVWGEENWLPDWLRAGNHTNDELREMIQEYISKVVGRYRGKVKEWSVVNEVHSRARHHYNLRDWWADRLGNNPFELDNYFYWANQADPGAKLLLNDFDNEVENAVSNDMYNYIKEAKARSVPIHGLGMQMHINGAKPPKKEAVIKNMQRFAAIGAPVYVTEFDVNINQVKGDDKTKAKIEAQVTYDMVRACIESKACVSFAEFGVTDKQEWLKKLANTDSHSFLFTSRFKPKPSFYAFRQAWLEP
jgi:endo-1,4-beta-xylanase